MLKAHPDLAGKLAAAGKINGRKVRLNKQALGLIYLQMMNETTFQDLNSQYIERYGFPFIIAVRDHTKAHNHGLIQASD